jgi:hypothetical protein
MSRIHNLALILVVSAGFLPRLLPAANYFDQELP